MKLLVVRAPGAPDALARTVDAALEAFNGELDIRLRFLSIGIEWTAVDVSSAADAADRVGAALAEAGADAALLVGGGEAAVAASAVIRRAEVPLVRAGAGLRGGDAGAERAADRLAAVPMPFDRTGADALRAEGLVPGEEIGDPSDPAAGRRIVAALAAARRRNPC
ncbi:MAG: hypothetical protein HMLKMBBP_03932 [Planctomycetes bacterium]|nr:hypothetical protein [Planctomycetota bacterium]